MTVAQDIQTLAPGYIVNLFELDTTTISAGGAVYYFHSGTNIVNTNVFWQGNQYIKFPIDADGFERSSSGVMARPKIKIANSNGVISALIRDVDNTSGNVYDTILGAKITRRRTFVKYLDAVNFPGAVNPYGTPDPNCGFNDEIWYVDRKSAENALYIEFELSSSFDIVGIALPRRLCIQNTCTWKYKSAECGWVPHSGAYYTANDAVTDSAHDMCGKRLTSCQLRYGNLNLPYGGFPGVGLLK